MPEVAPSAPPAATGPARGREPDWLASSPPHLRWPFRLLALLFVAAAGLAVFGGVRAWLRGEWQFGIDSLGDIGTVFACAVMTVVFAWAGVTGRVPDWLWRQFQRFVRLA